MGRHDHATPRGMVAIYGAASVVVLAVGAIAIWGFLERQALRSTLAPEPLPPVTVVTSDPDSDLAASWVDLLTRAEFAPTLVPVERYTPAEGVLALAGVQVLTPALEEGIRRKIAEGGGIAVLGPPPSGSDRLLGLAVTPGEPSTLLRVAEAASPVLARIRPGHEIAFARHEPPFLEENPAMHVDARWDGSARAAIAHYRLQRARILFFGFDPDSLSNPRDVDLGLLLRTAFRWVASQPVSDAALGMPAASKTLSPASRIRALDSKMTWSFDRLEEPGAFVLRIRNGGDENLPNPSVKIWYPERIDGLELAGNWFSRRNLDITPIDDEHAAVVSLTGLRPHEDRFIRIEGVTAR